MKLLYTIAILLLTSLVYGQKSTLIQNVNIDANELKHRLNISGDSLILEGERKIDKVNIFNSDFQQSFIVQKNSTIIPLNKVPVGRFVTEVKLRDKHVIITLLRHDIIKTTPALAKLNESRNFVNLDVVPLIAKTAQNKNDETQTLESDDLIKENEILDTKNSILTNENKDELSTTFVDKGRTEKTPEKIRTAYWVINMINNGHSSRKVTKFADIKNVERLIEQHQLDLKSKNGKFNELTILEVYDTRSFLKFKRINKDFRTSRDSDESFNSYPYFESTKHSRAL
ncbi:hypothetical protein [Winogradskyella ursingii]|uniref:hypothetical protein n=1 Tax=Winogradskyella ursingii TaxID=2686079 RepID=UPI0015C9815B|nr:hypothetical protein [Winogradskyella ursingii]